MIYTLASLFLALLSTALLAWCRVEMEERREKDQ